MSAFLRYLRGRHGFTLVEVIVASSILVLLIAVTGGIMLSSMGGFSRVTAMGEAKQLGLAIYDFYQEQLVEALSVSLENQASGDDQSLAVDGDSGHVLYNGEDLYGGTMYNGLQVRISDWAEDYILYLKVELWRDQDSDGLYAANEVVFVKESAYRINNLKRAGTSIGGLTGSADSPHVNGTIYYRKSLI